MSYFHPERMPVLPSGRRQAARQQLEQAVARSAIRARRRPAVTVAAIVIAAVCTGAATVGVAAYNAVTDRTHARCFTVASLDRGSAFYTTIAEGSKPATHADITNALRTCAGLFEMGVLRKGQRVRHSDFEPVPRAPHLVACRWHDGTVAVFPGDAETCRDMNLPAVARR